MQYRRSPPSFLPNGSSLLFTVLCRSWTTQAILDGGLCVWGLSSVQMHPLINWAVCFLPCTPFLFSFLIHNVEICLWSLRFAVPAGSNKLQTCFLSSNPTFAAPSLRHRPYHYPHKQQQQQQQKNASAILVLEEFSPPAFCQPPLSGISAVETSTECTQFATEKSTLVMNALVFSVGMSRTHRELTDNVKAG